MRTSEGTAQLFPSPRAPPAAATGSLPLHPKAFCTRPPGMALFPAAAKGPECFAAVLRSNPAWKKAAEYYPMTLKKTAELDPSKSYVFGFHPHGIISMSAFVAFATEGLNISKVFPGTVSCSAWLSVGILVIFAGRSAYMRD